MIAFYPLLRRIWIVLNGICAAFSLVVAVTEIIPGLIDGLGGASFFVFVAVLFAMVGAGLGLRVRWMVVLPAMALFLSSVLFSLAIAAGSPVWGPGHAGLTSALILGGLAVAFIQLVSPFLLRTPHHTARHFPQEP
jgi:hypothetical protein